MKKTIDINEQLKPGDIVDLHFKTYDPKWIKATQVAMIERALKNREGYEIIKSDYDTPGKVVMACRILPTNPIIVTAALIIGGIMAVGGGALAFGWMFEKAEKVVVPVTIGVVGIGIAAIILFIIIAKAK